MSLQAAESLSEPVIRIGKMAKAPVIDGVIDETEWEGSAEMQRFCTILERKAFNMDASFRVGRDDENVYIAVASQIGPHGQLRRVKPKGRPDIDAFSDDCIELDFIRDWHAPRPDVLHYIVNFNGAYHYRGKIDGVATNWEGMDDFRTASTERDGMCHFEFAIPLKSIRFDGADGLVHGIRIARNWKRCFYIGFGRQTSWSAQDGGFGTAANCPKVVFDDAAPAVRMTDFVSHRSFKDEHRAYPVAAEVLNPTARPLDLKIAYVGKPVNSQPCVFSEVFTLKPGERRRFSSQGAVLGDEMVSLNFKVTSADEKTVYYSRAFDFQANWGDEGWIAGNEDVKKVGFRYAYYPSLNRISAQVDLTNVDKRPNPAKFTLTVKSMKDEVLAQREFAAASDGLCDLEMDIPDLEPITVRTGEPKYAIELNVPGVKDGLVRGTFYRYDCRAWEHNKIGLSDTIPAPFTPVKIEKGKVKNEEVVSVVLREHTVDKTTGLWKQVTAAGKDLLARPMRLAGGPRSVAAASDGTEAVPPGVSASAEWDVDGVMDWKLTLKPGHYEPFALEIPLKGAEARLMHCCVDGLRDNYAGAVPSGQGRVWDSTKQGARISLIGNYLPYIWVGGTLRGVAVFGENDRGWTLDGKVPCQEIIREADGTVVVRLNLVQRAVDLKEPQTIRIGFQATPVKPMAKNWRAKPIGRMVGACWYWGGQGGGVEPFDGTTEYWDEMAKTRKTGKVNKAYIEDALKRFIYPGQPGSKEYVAHQETMRRHFYVGFNNMCVGDFHHPNPMVFYTNARGIEYGNATGKTYADEWSRSEYMPRLDRDFPRNYRRDYELDPVESFRDYAAYWYKKMVESGACDSLYWDDIYLSANFSRPLCETYRLPNGDWQPATGVFAMKALVRRCAVMQAEIGRDPMNNWVHMTNTSIAPILGFAGVNYDWEDTADLQTFQDRYGRDYLLASAIGRQFGNRVAVMGYISKTTPENRAWLERTGVGVTLCHEIRWGRVKQWRDANDRLCAWGYRTEAVRVWNDWDEDVAYPLATAGDACVSITMAKPEAKEAALVVSDWGEGGEIRLTPDVATLGIPADFSAVDMETGKTYPVADGVIRLCLKKHDYAMIQLK